MKGLGFKSLPKEKIDPRDYLFSTQKLVLEKDIPSVCDNRQFCGPVMNQQRTNACTGFAFASCKDMLFKYNGKSIRFYSPLFAYWNARDIEGWTNKDQGAYIFDIIKSYTQYGISPEKLHPFSLGVFKKPDWFAYGFAKFFVNKNLDYYKITDANMDNSFVDDVKLAIFHKYAVEGGILVYDEFETPINGVVLNKKDNSQLHGGHALHWVGYADLDDEQYQKALNGEYGIE